jgi:hypothetical protein
MSQGHSIPDAGEGSHPIENPYEPHPSLADYSVSTSLLDNCLKRLSSVYRRVFGIQTPEEDERSRFLNAYSAFFKLYPDAAHWVVAAQDPAALVTLDHWPEGCAVRRLSKDSIQDLPSALVLFDSVDVVSGAIKLTTQPLLEQCAFLVVPKSMSRELREAARQIFSEDVSQRIVSMKFFAAVLERDIAQQLRGMRPDTV